MWHQIGAFGSQVGQNLAANPWTAVNFVDDVVGAKNAWIVSPLVAYETARAPRGDKVPVFVSGAASLASLPVITGGATWALRLVAPTLGGPVGTVATFVASAIIAGVGSSWLRSSVHRTLRTLSEQERGMRRLEMGGWYRDSLLTAAYRQGAVSEMSGAFQAARTYLGQEAVITHR